MKDKEILQNETNPLLKVSNSSRAEKDYFLQNFASEDGLEVLEFSWEKNSELIASITFVILGEEVVSLPKAPFGGFWLEKKLNSEGLHYFIQAVVIELKNRGLKKIKISQAPRPYEPAQDLVNYLLFKEGFVQESILSHQFLVGKKKLKKAVQQGQAKFASRVKSGKLTVLCTPISNFGFLQEIKQWNQQRGYSDLVDENRIIQQVARFPERYFHISINRAGVNLAHSLVVKLTGNSLYYFLSAIDPKADLKNGGDLLLHQLLLLAIEQKSDFVDLGSSDFEDGVNHSLMFFKSRFSNEIANKIVWVRNL